MIDFHKIKQIREQLQRLVLPKDPTSSEYDKIWQRRIECHDAIVRLLHSDKKTQDDDDREQKRKGDY